MIVPENNIPRDDADYENTDDQLNQQDLHSKGFDDEVIPNEDEDNTAQVNQADEASGPSYTLDVDRGISSGPDEGDKI